MKAKKPTQVERLHTISMITLATTAVAAIIAFLGLAGNMIFGNLWPHGWAILFFSMVPALVASFLLMGMERFEIVLPCAIVSVFSGIFVPILGTGQLSSLVWLIVAPSCAMLGIQGVTWLVHIIGETLAPRKE
jgi:hypothetical protein